MGEYEPEDSRNVTGTASTPDGRWTNTDGKTPPGVPNRAARKPGAVADVDPSDKKSDEGGRTGDGETDLTDSDRPKAP